jgi:hypothetical protein
MKIRRYAIVVNARSRSEAEAYLPGNYEVIHEFDGAGMKDPIYLTPNRVWPTFVIGGVDRAGWTLDGYVIPRYASGVIGCKEIDLSHPIMKQVPALR